ncbi:RPL15 [Symbiodinium necroappetens]|uniref:RPL15 protein n=1 Tax=Symbiodinium necroappetens TaxID=1628268 RepID=A0A813BZH3_9DINO|nr:RPL15 [Symbiodinium necroappetens]
MQRGGFDLKSHLIQVHADYAPGIAAARRAVFPAVRLLGDYFHYKKAIRRQLPDKFPKLTKGQRRTKKLDPDVAKIFELSDLTRCLPTLQLADVIWQVIFEHCPAEASTYMQREFFSQASVQDLQRLFKRVGEPARGAKKLWVPSFWAGIFGTMPGSGGGTNPLEARHSSWEAELKGRTKDGLLSAMQGMQNLYRKWIGIFEWGKPIRMSCFSTEENEYLLNSATLRSQKRSPAVDYWKERHQGNYQKFHICNSMGRHESIA